MFLNTTSLAESIPAAFISSITPRASVTEELRLMERFMRQIVCCNFNSPEAEREHNSSASRIHYMQVPSIPLDPATLQSISSTSMVLHIL
jgi:hypothetical protein